MEDILRSSHQRCSMKKKGVPKNLAKFSGKHLSLIFNKISGLRHRCFPGNFTKFSRTPLLLLQNISGRLLLYSTIYKIIYMMSRWKKEQVKNIYIYIFIVIALYRLTYYYYSCKFRRSCAIIPRLLICTC